MKRKAFSIALLCVLLATACGTKITAKVPDLAGAVPVSTIGPGSPPSQSTPAPSAGGLPNQTFLMYATIGLAGVAVLAALLALMRPSQR